LWIHAQNFRIGAHSTAENRYHTAKYPHKDSLKRKG
jgi:hypothetical protein